MGCGEEGPGEAAWGLPAGGLEYPQTLCPHTQLWEGAQSDLLLFSLELENRGKI